MFLLDDLHDDCLMDLLDDAMDLLDLMMMVVLLDVMMMVVLLDVMMLMMVMDLLDRRRDGLLDVVLMMNLLGGRREDLLDDGLVFDFLLDFVLLDFLLLDLTGCLERRNASAIRWIQALYYPPLQERSLVVLIVRLQCWICREGNGSGSRIRKAPEPIEHGGGW